MRECRSTPSKFFRKLRSTPHSSSPNSDSHSCDFRVPEIVRDPSLKVVVVPAVQLRPQRALALRKVADGLLACLLKLCLAVAEAVPANNSEHVRVIRVSATCGYGVCR